MTSLHPNERQRREFKLQRELGPDLVALMRDPEVREVMVNPDGRVFSITPVLASRRPRSRSSRFT